MSVFHLVTEADRLRAVEAHEILDTPPERGFDAIARLASQLCETPIALVTLVDHDRVWFKARIGIDETEVLRDVSFCPHAILEPDVMVVEDALEDERFADNPLVTKPPHLRFYAGAPLVGDDGHALGTLCAIDHEPRRPRTDQIEALRMLAAQVVSQLELRRAAADSARSERITAARSRHSELMLQAAGEGIFGLDRDGRLTFANPKAAELVGYPLEQLLGVSMHGLIHHSHPDGTSYPIETCRAHAAIREGRARHVCDEVFWRADGTSFPVEYTSTPLVTDGEVQGAVVVFSDITDRRKLENRMRFEANHDALTGLYSRRHFETQLTAELAAAEQTGRGGALLMLDIDHFKLVNDSLGHSAGDALLQRFTLALRDATPDTPIIARLGGDEFAVLLPDVDEAQARAVAERVLSAGSLRFERMAITLSVGVALFGADTASPDDVLAAADIALYQAKEAGRDRLAVYSGWKGRSLVRVEQIAGALRDDRLALVSQPIVELPSGRVVAEEVLVRMIDEDGSLLAPGVFLPPAERFGLIQEIDRWVACRAADLACGERRIHVNVSGRSLGDHELVRTIAERLEKAGASPENLVFELTETAVVSDLSLARGFAERLGRLGCGFALDDFGTGFGSFTWLKQLPVGVLKIDAQFVKNLARSNVDRCVVGAVVSIARSLGQRTVAEGVEDASSLEALKQLGVDYAQGYYLGRPAPVGTEWPAVLPAAD